MSQQQHASVVAWYIALHMVQHATPCNNMLNQAQVLQYAATCCLIL